MEGQAERSKGQRWFGIRMAKGKGRGGEGRDGEGGTGTEGQRSMLGQSRREDKGRKRELTDARKAKASAAAIMDRWTNSGEGQNG